MKMQFKQNQKLGRIVEASFADKHPQSVFWSKYSFAAFLFVNILNI